MYFWNHLMLWKNSTLLLHLQRKHINIVTWMHYPLRILYWAIFFFCSLSLSFSVVASNTTLALFYIFFLLAIQYNFHSFPSSFTHSHKCMHKNPHSNGLACFASHTTVYFVHIFFYWIICFYTFMVFDNAYNVR